LNETGTHDLQVVTRPSLFRGRPVRLDTIQIAGQTYQLGTGPVSIASLEDEWYGRVRDPEAVIRVLEAAPHVTPDIFTFRQQLPDTGDRWPFHTEWESIAVLPITSAGEWWAKQIKPAVRNKIRKSQKAGVEVRDCAFDDDFVEGMTAIFNEVPVRQGRRFWHYGKSAAQVKREFSRFLFREHLIGAYYRDELVGFAMLGMSETFGDLTQIIAKIEHRDKAVANALIARSVEVCVEKRLPSLVYAYWGDSTLADFKRQSGFEEVRLPRYYVPLSRKGELALRLGLHRGWRALLPAGLAGRLKALRSRWYELTRG
jgi:hypothetical protein